MTDVIISAPGSGSFVTTANTNSIIQDGSSVTINNPSPQDIAEINFSWGDATPSPIMLIGAGKRVWDVELHITTAFNGTGAALSVGDAGNVQALMPTGANDPKQVVEFFYDPDIIYGSATQLNLYITPGAGASAGAGVVRIIYQR